MGLPFAAVLLVLAGTGGVARAEAVSDLVVGYSATWRSGMGGTDQTNAAIYNQIAGANGIAANSGSPHRQNVVATKESAFDATNVVDCGAMIGWMENYDSRITDVLAVADNLGADLVTYIGDMYDNGAAAQAEQPGRYSCYEQQWWWMNVAAHESGGHNFGLDHRDGVQNPKTIMLHNYCTGGSNGFYSNPNIWLNGIRLIGVGSCLGGTAGAGGDNTYALSTSAQGVADRRERLVYGSDIGSVQYRWQFNQAAGAAPAGTVVAGTGGNAVVRGNGATFTGSALRLPGGTTGNVAGSSIAAYVDLPNGIFSAMPNFTIEVWATPLSAKNWMRILDIGRTTETGDGTGAAGEYTPTAASPAPGGTSSYDDIMLSGCIGTDLNWQRFEAKLGGAGVVTADSNMGTTAGAMHHYAITFTDTTTGGTIKWFRDGVLVKALNVTFHSASLHDVNNWLGRSLWSGDDMANIDYHDVRIQNIALADGKVAANYRMGPNNAKATLWANDGWGNSGFTSGAWEFGNVPSPVRDYETGTMRLITPWTTTDSTFPGKSLTVTGGNLYLAGKDANTVTVSDLRLDGGTIHSLGDGGSKQVLAGQITVQNSSLNQIRGEWGEMVISANIVGTDQWDGMLYTEGAVTLTGNNANYHGATIVGDGRFGTVRISSETNLGGNPYWFGGAWLELNRGILETTQTMTIDDANRGICIGPSGGFLNPWQGTTLTIASPINSPAAGNTLQTAPMDSNPIMGILFVGGGGTVELTNPNNSHNAEMQITWGEMKLSGNGRLNNGDHWMPFLINGTFTDNSAQDQTLRGAISGNGVIVKGNTSTLNVNGSNPFTGSVTVNGGTLYANPGNAATDRALSYAGIITVNSGGTLRAGTNGLFGWDGTQEKTITVNAGGTLTANGGLTSDVGVGTVILNGGTLATLATGATDWGSWRFDNATDKLSVIADSTVSATNVKFGNVAATIDVAAGKSLNFTGTITDTTSGGISYLTKGGGSGTLVLAGTNTYTGATAVNTGTLRVNGSTAAGSAVTVAGGATLGGSGTVSGSLSFTSSAIHAPGNPAGTQTVGGALVYANGSRLRWTLPVNSNATGAASRVSAGTVSVTSGALIDLAFNAPGSNVNFTDSFWSQTRTWNVMSCTGKSGSFALGTVSTDAGGRQLSSYGTLSLQQSATSLDVTFTPYTPTELWRQSNFGINWNNSAISGDTVDVDRDGLSNLLEYAVGADPNTADSSAAPKVTVSGGKLKILFNRNTSATDLVLSVVAADTPTGPWTAVARSTNGAAFSVLAVGATVQEQGSTPLKAVQAEDIYLVPDASHPRRFMRLEVSR
ncbi:hypothetical protein llg_40680 [Luteolibacter sp. LG18]|nr:hypothetical protein llg_40680 [Luteolibacter sp. LG18]